MSNIENNRDGGISSLRRYTVFVMLSLLIFLLVGNFIDDVFLGNRFTIDSAFFALVGGMITGLFSAEAINAWRGRKDE